MQQTAFHIVLFGKVNESTEIFWQAVSTEAEPGIQEFGSNTRVQAQPHSDFGDVRINRFAHVGEHVDEGDFRGEKCVCCVFN